MNKPQSNKSLEKLFNLTPQEIEPELMTKTGLVIPLTDNIVDTDYQAARTNIYELLEQGKTALDLALKIAQSSEHPRALEVLSNMIKQMAEINQQLLELQVTKTKLVKEPEVPTNGGVVNNTAVFVGTSTELNKMISDIVKGK